MARKKRETSHDVSGGDDEPVQDFEKLGVFYLGRRYDPASKHTKPELLLYDSKDLVTHAVCVGMTGSGKTGLCIGLLEEAAIDGIPAIIIDPKGDLANLLLTFPTRSQRLRALDQRGRCAEERSVTCRGLSRPNRRSLWKNGLAEWGQDGAAHPKAARVRPSSRLHARQQCGHSRFDPQIVRRAASTAIRDDDELLRERISTTVTSLLGLLGIDADPIKSREHILLPTILDQCLEGRQRSRPRRR